MPVRVDEDADRLVGDLANRGQDFSGSFERELRVDHDHIVVADDEDGVGVIRESERVGLNDGVDVGRDLVDAKMRRLERGIRAYGARDNNQQCGESNDDFGVAHGILL